MGESESIIQPGAIFQLFLGERMLVRQAFGSLAAGIAQGIQLEGGSSGATNRERNVALAGSHAVSMAIFSG